MRAWARRLLAALPEGGAVATPTPAHKTLLPQGELHVTGAAAHGSTLLLRGRFGDAPVLAIHLARGGLLAQPELAKDGNMFLAIATVPEMRVYWGKGMEMDVLTEDGLYALLVGRSEDVLCQDFPSTVTLDRALAKPKRHIITVLLDPHVCAGCGPHLASEALHAADIHPKCLARNRDDVLRALAHVNAVGRQMLHGEHQSRVFQRKTTPDGQPVIALASKIAIIYTTHPA